MRHKPRPRDGPRERVGLAGRKSPAIDATKRQTVK